MKCYDFNDDAPMASKTAEEAGHFNTVARETSNTLNDENVQKPHMVNKPAPGPFGDAGTKKGK